jgi:hypothetical protein
MYMTKPLLALSFFVTVLVGLSPMAFAGGTYTHKEPIHNTTDILSINSGIAAHKKYGLQVTGIHSFR